MNKLNQSKKANLNLVYEGSVKRIWKPLDKEGLLQFEFTDAYSVFDWGKMPDDIKDKGTSLTLMGEYFFQYFSQHKVWEKLKSADLGLDKNWLFERFEHESFKNMCRYGLPHHFVRTVDNEFLEVVEGIVPKATAQTIPGIKGSSVYCYENLPSNKNEGSGKRFLVPLEVVFRFGLPQGSSLIDRLKSNPEYAKSLGLPADTKIEPNSKFSYPVLEFYTKLEPSDRLLSLQEAVLLSGLTYKQFDELVEQTLMLSVALRQFFAERKVELWDGKFEFLVEYDTSGKTRILLADSIGPDELRLIYRNCHLSKEILRQIYKNSDWAKELSQAKKSSNKDWKKLVKKGPEPLSPETKKIVDQLYPVITNCIFEKDIFEGYPKLDEYVNSLENLLNS